MVAEADGSSVLLDTGSGHSGHRLIERFQEVFELVEKPAVVGVDIPVGLLERAVKGGRQCDREVRPILGQPRARSVFSPPVRGALHCTDYASANKSNRESSPDRVGISTQSFGLRQKLLEMDGLITPKLQEIVKEVHPELSFYELNDRRPLKHGKKDRTGAGLAERRALLRNAGFDGIVSKPLGYPRTKVGEDDILDACAACWTAARILGRNAVRIPERPPEDKRRLLMEIWR